MSRKKIKSFKLEDIYPPQPAEKTWQEERDSEIEKRFIDIKPLNKAQERFLNAIYTSVITIGRGCAGSGRSFMSCAAALKLFYEGKIDKIILTRPQIECGNSGGFLPGDAQDKLIPYLMPLIDVITEFIGEKEFQKLLKLNKIKLESLGLMRGSSFKNTIIILDEAQNATYFQLKMILTRIGKNCKLIINGDSSQSDLKIVKTDFDEIIKKLKPLKDEISFIEFLNEDCVRSGIVKKMLELI